MLRSALLLWLGLSVYGAWAQETVSLRCTVTSKSWAYARDQLIGEPVGRRLPLEINFDIVGNRGVSVTGSPGQNNPPTRWIVDATPGFFVLRHADKPVGWTVTRFSARINRTTGVYTLEFEQVDGIMKDVFKAEGPCEKRQTPTKF